MAYVALSTRQTMITFFGMNCSLPDFAVQTSYADVFMKPLYARRRCRQQPDQNSHVHKQGEHEFGEVREGGPPAAIGNFCHQPSFTDSWTRRDDEKTLPFF